jgi:hypothetical protein
MNLVGFTDNNEKLTGYTHGEDKGYTARGYYLKGKLVAVATTSPNGNSRFHCLEGIWNPDQETIEVWPELDLLAEDYQLPLTYE